MRKARAPIGWCWIWLVLDPDHPAIAAHCAQSWLSGLVFCEHGESPIYDVVVGGQIVVEARRHRSEAAALRDYQAALAALRD